MLSTDSTLEDLSQHKWKIVDWVVKHQKKKKKKITVLYKVKIKFYPRPTELRFNAYC